MVVGIVALVSGGEREADPARCGIDDRGVERRADAAAKAHVGDVARLAVGGDIVDAGDDARVGAAAAAIEDADRDHVLHPARRRSRRSCFARGDDAGDVRAVAVLVGGRVLPPRKLRLRAVSTVRSGWVTSMPVSITHAVAKVPAAPPPTRVMPHGVFCAGCDAAAAARGGHRRGSDRWSRSWSCSQ